MKQRKQSIIKKLSKTRIAFILSIINNILVFVQIIFLKIIWIFSENKKTDSKEVQLVHEQVTFIYKSFERQKMAKCLYRNIQSYYPGVKVIIAYEYVEVIQLPFNSGLSAGLNRALQHVTTPFVIRLDDDNIRMIDHNEFFYRAAGRIISCLDTECYVIHYHN